MQDTDVKARMTSNGVTLDIAQYRHKDTTRVISATQQMSDILSQ
jgi:hypothetical protein